MCAQNVMDLGSQANNIINLPQPEQPKGKKITTKSGKVVIMTGKLDKKWQNWHREVLKRLPAQSQ